MAFGTVWTTILFGRLQSCRRWRHAVRSLSGARLALGRRGHRRAWPRRVRPDHRRRRCSWRRTPVFNALLPGYGIPALAFGFAAWQLARTTGGRPRLVMEAAAALFALLTLAMLVRHAMNGGVIDDDAPTLAEQAIYTLIAIGAGRDPGRARHALAEFRAAHRLAGRGRGLGRPDRRAALSVR